MRVLIARDADAGREIARRPVRERHERQHVFARNFREGDAGDFAQKWVFFLREPAIKMIVALEHFRVAECAADLERKF